LDNITWCIIFTTTWY